ncbi:MAG: PAS domain S-box protein [Planctomycetes bacterium]|nr:PAS domain S-box protein [Planctomycetota bacterium]
MKNYIKLLKNILSKIPHTESFSEAIRIVLREVCETTGWAYGEVWVPSPEGNYLVCGYVCHYTLKPLEKFAEASKTITFPPGIGLPGHVWVTKKPSWIIDVTENDNFLRAAIAKECGIKTGMAIPILDAGELLAVVAFFVNEKKQEDEEMLEFVSIIADELVNITQYKKLEIKNAQLSQAVEQSACCIIITDIHGTIQYVNPKFTHLTGYAIEEVIGQNPRILKTDKTSSDDYKELWEKITSGASWQGEFYNRKKNGEYYWELAQITPLKDKEGQVTGFLGIKEDITEIKRIEKEKEELREHLYHTKKLEAIGRLAGGIAHEFNNILMAVVGYANLAKLEMGDDHYVSKYLRNITDVSDRAANLIQGILSFSRKQPLHDTKPMSLNTLIVRSEVIFSRFFRGNINYIILLKNASEKIFLSRKSSRPQLMTFQCFATNICT